MANEKDLKQAQTVFATLCQALDNHDWHYGKDEEELSIECGAQGEDLPMQITIKVDAERKLAILLSHIPVLTPEDKRLEVAIAVSVVNNKLVDGSFDYDVNSGMMVFRMTNSFMESKIGEDLFMYMLLCSCRTIDEYNDKFLMLAKGLLPLEKFLAE